MIVAIEILALFNFNFRRNPPKNPTHMAVQPATVNTQPCCATGVQPTPVKRASPHEKRTFVRSLFGIYKVYTPKSKIERYIPFPHLASRISQPEICYCTDRGGFVQQRNVRTAERSRTVKRAGDDDAMCRQHTSRSQPCDDARAQTALSGS